MALGDGTNYRDQIEFVQCVELDKRLTVLIGGFDTHATELRIVLYTAETSPKMSQQLDCCGDTICW